MVASRNNNCNARRIHKLCYFAAEQARFGVFLVDTREL
jgi:hypothetical protein